MLKMYRVLVPLGEDPTTARAIAWGEALTSAVGGDLVLAWLGGEPDESASSQDRERYRREANKRAWAELESIAGGLRCAIARLAVVENHSVTRLVEIAGEVKADLIVAAGEAWIENEPAPGLTMALAREAALPVLAIGAEVPPEDVEVPRRILAPFDGSSLSRSIFARLAPLARRLDARVIVFRALQVPGLPAPSTENPGVGAERPRDLEALADDLRQRGLMAEAVARFGAPAEAILRAVEEENVDCIALSTHSREGLMRLFVGSVAEQVLADAVVPVLLFHPTPEAPEELLHED